MMKKWKTKKAIASQKKIDKMLAAYGKAYLSSGKPFFAAQTFDDKTGTWKICDCCGGASIHQWYDDGAKDPDWF